MPPPLTGIYLSTWDISRLTTLRRVFYAATAFNGDVSTWNTSGVTDLEGMFTAASAFNRDLSDWDVSRVTSLYGMFASTAFNGNLSTWDVSGVTTLRLTFASNLAFNGDVSTWDVSRVTTLQGMFQLTWGGLFNGDMSAWDVSRVINIGFAFWGASSFNADVSAWDVSGATRMYQAFNDASVFDRDLSTWDVSSVADMSNLFTGSPALDVLLCGGAWIDSKAARNAGDAAVKIADTDSGTSESPSTCYCSAGTYLQPRVDSSEAWNKKYEGCYPCPQDEYSLGGDKQTCLKCNQLGPSHYCAAGKRVTCPTTHGTTCDQGAIVSAFGKFVGSFLPVWWNHTEVASGTGRYVRISSAPNQQINLMEARVFDSTGTEIGLTASMSNVYSSAHVAFNCVDGDVSTMCYTEQENGWLELDMGRSKHLFSLCVLCSHFIPPFVKVYQLLSAASKSPIAMIVAGTELSELRFQC